MILAWVAYEIQIVSALEGELRSDKRIDLYESTLLGAFLCGCLWIFGLRRLRDLRREMTRLAEAEKRAVEAESQARRDHLTELGNRIVFDESLSALTAEGEAAALILLDLNHFKQINDRLGHPVGDRVLKIVSQRLRFSTRKGDILSRLGGDEFALIAYGLFDANAGSGAARHIAENIIRAIDQPMNVGGHSVTTGVSIGIAYYPQDGRTPQELFEKADKALYAAKEAARTELRSVYRIAAEANLC
ncbi:GGDEF domain-containing protein [Microvirga sp. GCM10011540]|uniref:GGDEF domain-containing protein n=1 Tax=Microvirga sp. GCM10011540 TaxID=3317338 RepID=UPI003613B99D